MTILDDLMDVGLSEYEAKTYRALVEYGEQTGRKLSESSGVPPTRVFDVLKTLQDKGLVELIKQKPMVWLAIKPGIGLDILVKRKNTAYTELCKRLIGELKLARLEPEGKISEKVVMESGFQNTIATITEQVRNSGKEVCSFWIGDALPVGAEIENARAVRRGVAVRQIIRVYTQKNKKTVEKWVKDGSRVRYLSGSEDYSFFVFDKRRCAIVVKDPKVEKERVIIVFENRGLSTALRYYFESLWKSAEPIRHGGL